MAIALLNVRFVLLISASFIAIFSSIAVYFCLPILISHVIRTQISLSLSSGTFNDWRTNSVIDRLYLYNITNFDELFGELAVAQRDKQSWTRVVPKLEQIGPFAFRQERDKSNIRFDSRNETVTYDQQKRWIFVPELSLYRTFEELNSSMIYHMSPPLAGTTLNAEYAPVVDPVVSENDMRLFLKHSVATLLFEGYYDILMEQAKSAGQIDTDRFGWLNTQNNSITRDVRIFTGPSNATMNKFGLMSTFQNEDRLSIWHNNQTKPNNFDKVVCNEFKTSSAGEFFPPPEQSIISYKNYNDLQELKTSATKTDMKTSDTSMNNTRHKQDKDSTSTAMDRHFSLTDLDSISSPSDDELKKFDQKVGKTIAIFLPDLCRSIKLHYIGSHNYRDLLVDRYIANEFTYDYTGVSEDSQANRCFCIYNESSQLTSCPPNGMMDLYSCRKGSPVTISFPHFLYSTADEQLSPFLRLFDDQVKPNESEHQLFIDLESTLNIPVKVQIVIQFNVHFRLETNYNFTKEYSFLFDSQAEAINQTSSTAMPATTSKDLYLPQMWIKSSAEVRESDLKNLRFIQKDLGYLRPIITGVMLGLASILLMASAKLAYDLSYGPKSRKSLSCNQESCSSLNRNHSCSDDCIATKKKFFDMQLLDSDNQKSVGNQCNSRQFGDHLQHQNDDRQAHEKPSTSKRATSRIGSGMGEASKEDEAENEPLNE